jgi:uncharacterized ion transporter superfamily protein YfcC
MLILNILLYLKLYTSIIYTYKYTRAVPKHGTFSTSDRENLQAIKKGNEKFPMNGGANHRTISN